MKTNPASRRSFLHRGAVLSAGALLAPRLAGHAAGSDRIGVAMIGCGDRGTKDAIDCLKADPAVEIVAMADMFQDRINSSLAKLRKEDAARVKVTPKTTFLGFDAYRRVLGMPEVKIVMLLTPPGFRPPMVRAAVEAGKHLFVEKPGAVDPVGVRSLLASA
jgi:predicted dehydrogenase